MHFFPASANPFTVPASSELRRTGALEDERFQALFSLAAQPLFVVDRRGAVKARNAAALRALGPEGRAAENFLLRMVAPGEAEAVAWALSSAALDGAAECPQVVFRTRDGRDFKARLELVRLDAQEEEHAHYVCALSDCPADAEQHHAGAFDGVLLLDAERRVARCNPAACALFKATAEQLVGRPIEQLLPQVLPAGELRSARLRGVKGRDVQGSDLHLDLNLVHEAAMTVASSTVFLRDASQRRREAQQRELLQAQLRESHKMQTLGTLAGGIAHDFNNILSAILGNLELARRELGQRDAADASLAEIEKAGQRARELVLQILRFSRKEAQPRSPLRLADVVRESARLLRASLPGGAQLFQEIAEDVPVVLADAIQIEQVVLNLGTNALQAIGTQGGSVTISLSGQRPTEAQRERLGLADRSYAALTVSDTGGGMDEATLSRIFEPFFTTKSVGEGTGLGLAVVEGIVRTHEGAIDVNSTPGHGSRFTIYLPALDDPSHARSAPSDIGGAGGRRAEVDGAGHRVIYIDDDDALVYLVERLLTRQGFQVRGYSDPREALQALQEDPQGCDLLVTDCNIPGFSGAELARQARRVRPDLRVALASGYVTAAVEADALEIGACAVINKPAEVHEMCAIVQRLIRS